jgi:hypothetical protein
VVGVRGIRLSFNGLAASYTCYLRLNTGKTIALFRLRNRETEPVRPGVRRLSSGRLIKGRTALIVFYFLAHTAAAGLGDEYAGRRKADPAVHFERRLNGQARVRDQENGTVS